MSNENEKQWWKTPRYLSLIIGILAIVVTIILAIWQYSLLPPDFSISINPMQGAVQQGGVITTAITINGVHGYKQQVSLSDAVQLSGVSVAFSQSYSTPPYTSTVTIKVDSGVSTGVYQIKIRGKGGDGKEQWCEYILTVNPTPVMPTPTPTITPIPVITSSIIDTMDSTSGWKRYNGTGTESSINFTSVSGRTGNAIAISYDMEEGGYVSIIREITPEILSGKEGIKFYYKGSGKPSTLALILVYGDPEYTSFGVEWYSATVRDDWESIEVPYTYFDCWWPEDNCLHYGNKLDLKNVRAISFAIMNNYEAGDIHGSGRVIIDDVQGITS
jgi:uncharacterized membrane protein